MENVKVWPEWKIEKLIGEGSYGKVYKVRRENQGRTEYAALKVIEIPKNEAEISELKASGLDDNSIQTYYEHAANDLFNEIKIMESLRSAPNVVTLQDALLEKKEEGIGWTIYIRMELLQSMGSYLQGRNLTKEEVMKLGTDISSAIVSCEKAHIIHRDIKPQNIFVNTFGDFKLGDFGIAKQLEKTGSVHSMKGTTMYMAPEVMKGQAYDHTVDIYSLGIMLYRYLNHGRAPFYPPYPNPITPIDIDNATQKKIDGEKMPAPDEADEEQARIILKACSYYPLQRYQSAEKMNRDLLKWKLTNSEGDNNSSISSEFEEILEEEVTGSLEQLKSEETTVLSRGTQNNTGNGQENGNTATNTSFSDYFKQFLSSGSKNTKIAASAIALGLVLICIIGYNLINGSGGNRSSDNTGLVAANKPGRDSSEQVANSGEGSDNAATGMQDVGKIWTVEPTFPFEYVTDIITYSDGQFSGLTQEATGYSISWTSNYNCNAIKVGYNGKIGVYDFYGNNLCPVSLGWMETDYDAGTSVFFAEYNNSYYYLSEDFASLIPVNYGGKGAEGPFQFYAVKNGVFGEVTGSFEDRHFAPYDISSLNLSGRSAVYVVDDACYRIGWTVIDRNGTVLTDTYNGCPISTVSNTAFVNSVISVSDVSPEHVNEYYAYVGYDYKYTGKVGFVNADTGVQITDVIYEDAKSFQDGYAPVKKNGKWAYIDKEGNEVTDFIFDDASMLYSGYAYVKYDGYYGILNIAELARNNIPVNHETCGNNRTEFTVSDVPQGVPNILSDGLGTVVVKVNKLNIRSGPSTSYQAVGRCNIGDSFDVYDTSSDGKYTWYKIGEGRWIADENGSYVHFHQE